MSHYIKNKKIILMIQDYKNIINLQLIKIIKKKTQINKKKTYKLTFIIYTHL